MREDGKEVFTRQEINADIKGAYKSKIIIWAIVTAFLIIVFLAFLPRIDNDGVAKWLWRLFFGAFPIFSLFMVCHGIYKCFQCLEYQIVSDVFVFEHFGHNNINSSKYHCVFNFKTYGDFDTGLAKATPFFDSENSYYKWSRNFCMSYDGLVKRTFQGDEYYLIIINNKIRYVYNKKIFEFKETEKA